MAVAVAVVVAVAVAVAVRVTRLACQAMVKARHHGRSLMRRARARHWQRNTRRAVCIWRRWTRDRLRYKDANLVAASLQRAHLARRVWDALRSHVTEVLHHRSQLQHAHMYWRYKVLRRVLRGVRRFCIYSRQVRPTPRPPNPACRPGVRANASLRSCVWLCVCACACACVSVCVPVCVPVPVPVVWCRVSRVMG